MLPASKSGKRRVQSTQQLQSKIADSAETRHGNNYNRALDATAPLPDAVRRRICPRPPPVTSFPPRKWPPRKWPIPTTRCRSVPMMPRPRASKKISKPIDPGQRCRWELPTCTSTPKAIPRPAARSPCSRTIVRSLRTKASISPDQNRIDVEGTVEYRDPQLVIRGKPAASTVSWLLSKARSSSCPRAPRAAPPPACRWTRKAWSGSRTCSTPPAPSVNPTG